MATLTITLDEAVLKRARLRALERGESVNKVLARSLEDYAGGDDVSARKERAARRFVSTSRTLAGASSGSWTREDLYKDRDVR